jgi:hypothetical protein
MSHQVSLRADDVIDTIKRRIGEAGYLPGEARQWPGEGRRHAGRRLWLDAWLDDNFSELALLQRFHQLANGGITERYYLGLGPGWRGDRVGVTIHVRADVDMTQVLEVPLERKAALMRRREPLAHQVEQRTGVAGLGWLLFLAYHLDAYGDGPSRLGGRLEPGGSVARGDASVAVDEQRDYFRTSTAWHGGLPPESQNRVVEFTHPMTITVRMGLKVTRGPLAQPVTAPAKRLILRWDQARRRPSGARWWYGPGRTRQWPESATLAGTVTIAVPRNLTGPAAAAVHPVSPQKAQDVWWSRHRDDARPRIGLTDEHLGWLARYAHPLSVPAAAELARHATQTLVPAWARQAQVAGFGLDTDAGYHLAEGLSDLTLTAHLSHMLDPKRTYALPVTPGTSVTVDFYPMEANLVPLQEQAAVKHRLYNQRQLVSNAADTRETSGSQGMPGISRGIRGFAPAPLGLFIGPSAGSTDIGPELSAVRSTVAAEGVGTVKVTETDRETTVDLAHYYYLSGFFVISGPHGTVRFWADGAVTVQLRDLVARQLHQGAPRVFRGALPELPVAPQSGQGGRSANPAEGYELTGNVLGDAELRDWFQAFAAAGESLAKKELIHRVGASIAELVMTKLGQDLHTAYLTLTISHRDLTVAQQFTQAAVDKMRHPITLLMPDTVTGQDRMKICASH